MGVRQLRRMIAWSLLIVVGAGLACVAAGAGVPPKVRILELEGSIGPATSDYFARALEKAAEDQVEVVVLRMDTPGGLDTSMRSIIKRIVASAVPVVSYVAPSGARAASAGTYILYASHVAAMAPGTNLGAATPVQLGGLPGGLGREKDQEQGETEDEGADPSAGKKPASAMTQKLVNDAVAYLKGLAQLRGRNAEWAEKAVREAASLPAEEALREGVIDLIAPDVQDLLAQLQGRAVDLGGKERVLNTQGAVVERVVPDWRSRLLSVIANPSIAYVMMLIGIYGLIYEFANPGAIVPGTLGTISLLLALYAFQLLPINYAGVGLLLLGLALMVAEAFVPSFGALGIGGIVAFVIGSVILIDTDAPGYGIALPLILSFAVVSALAMFGTLSFALKARSRPVVSGQEELIGAIGRVVDGGDGEASVRIHGEIWAARSDQALKAGERVEITGIDGLTLMVRRTQLERKDQ